MKKKERPKRFLLKHERVQAAGTQAVGEKNFVFGRNTLQIVIFFYFIVLPPYPLKKHMTGGYDVRVKAGPNL
jgi:hypothetical protein